ncbi:MAG: 3-dehydroquinate synthase, partial [Planctomycetales bacterium]
IKNDIHVLERMLKVFHVSDLDRRSYVVVIGGGAVLDAVGFAASIAHRGIRLVRIPTTTLSQADSAVGVKNGVNLFHKKNWLGSFAVPWAVINDAQLLKTLSDRDYICGFAETVKVSLLKDAPMFDRICADAARIRHRDSDISLPFIRQSAEWHIRHITEGGDPFEQLEARPLDFGHWSAHKLEAMSQFQLRHGEAVAIGIAIDTVYSAMMHGFPEEAANRVLQCLKKLGFSLQCDDISDTNTLFAGLEEFRQHLGGRLTLTMLRGVGDPFEVHQVDRPAMAEAIDRVGAFAESCS